MYRPIRSYLNNTHYTYRRRYFETRYFPSTYSSSYLRDIVQCFNNRCGHTTAGLCYYYIGQQVLGLRRSLES